MYVYVSDHGEMERLEGRHVEGEPGTEQGEMQGQGRNEGRRERGKSLEGRGRGREGERAQRKGERQGRGGERETPRCEVTLKEVTGQSCASAFPCCVRQGWTAGLTQ